MGNQPTDISPSNSIYVSVELSKRSWLVASLSPGAARPSLKTISAGATATLLSHLQHLERRASEQRGEPVDIRLCFEIGYDGFWLARLLLANGIATYVLDPASSSCLAAASG